MTDPPTISSTTLSEEKSRRKKEKKWQVTHDMSHVTHDMWYVTHGGGWHMLGYVVGGEHSLKIPAP